MDGDFYDSNRDNKHKNKSHENNKTQESFLKWFRVRFSPTFTVIRFLPTLRKCYTLNLKFGRVSVRENKRRSLSLRGFALYIDPYDCYFNIKSYHFMYNQRIFIGLMVMMNLYKQRLAFRVWFMGFWPLSALQSHLPPLYLGADVCVCPGSCDLDLEPWHGDLCQWDDLLVSLRSFSLWPNCYRLGSSHVVRWSELMQPDNA